MMIDKIVMLPSPPSDGEQVVVFSGNAASNFILITIYHFIW